MPIFDGLIPLKEGGTAVLRITGTETDPVARAAARERLVRAVVNANPELAVRVGGRLFFLDRRPNLLALAEALGVIPAKPKPARAKRASSPSSAEVAA